jgi:uncharacterized membrane protein YdjX (TVP38/TMEM64 family)
MLASVVGLLASVVGLLMLRALDPSIVSQETLSNWIQPFGPYAPLVFILFLAVRPVTLLPGQIFTAVGGMMFGTLHGSLYAMAGSLLATGLIYVLSRKLGMRLMKRLAGGKYPALERVAKRHDFTFAFAMCINPLFPTDVMIAAAAASGARFGPTALGILLGTLPGTFLTAQFGSALGQGRPVMTALSAGGLVLSLVLGVFVGSKVYKEVNGEEADVPEVLPKPRPTAPPRLPLAQRLRGWMRASSVTVDG